MIRRQGASVVLGFAIAVSLLAVGAPQAAATGDTDSCASAPSIRSLAPGGRIHVPARCLGAEARIAVGGHDVPVPQVGTGVGSHYLSVAEADSSELVVENVDGVLAVSYDAVGAADPAAAVAAAASPSACSDNYSSWVGVRNNGWGYYLNTSVLPTGISGTTFQSEAQLAEGVLESGGNDCGLATGLSLFDIDITKLGGTTVPAAGTDGSCRQDSTDVIDFGYLPKSASGGQTLGHTCYWYTLLPFADDVIYAADVRLNKSSKWFSTIPSGCTGAYELEGVLVHEFGHVFGLTDIPEDTHGNLTMSAASTPCSYADHSWGRGDYNSLFAHY